MNIVELKDRQNISNESKLNSLYAQFNVLLNELRKKELPSNVFASINERVEQLNSSPLTGKELMKLIKQEQTKILKQVEKECKIVPQNHYRTLWMVFGMSGIGIPIGVAIGLSIGNIGLLGLGFPIGMGIGFIIGMQLDKKAMKEGRQLEVEIKY